MISSLSDSSSDLTEATKKAYRWRADCLLRRWRQGFGSQNQSPFDFVRWLLDQRRGLKSATFRQYKSAALHCLPQVFAGSEDLHGAMEYLRSAQAMSNRHLPLRTSARKMRFLLKEDWERLSDWLLRKGLSDGAIDSVRTPVISFAALEAWCRATLLCALRPTEWAKTEWREEGERFFVIVRNAKATQGRSHGETRTLVFDRLDSADREAICATIELARAWAAKGKSAVLQKLVADTLYRAARAALGRREAYPSLYTFRHQAIANWKTERSALEVAAMCGHARTETAIRHYASRRHAWRGGRPKVAGASPLDILAVRLRNLPSLTSNNVTVPDNSALKSGR
jgi:hypothetical protein